MMIRAIIPAVQNTRRYGEIGDAKRCNFALEKDFSNGKLIMRNNSHAGAVVLVFKGSQCSDMTIYQRKPCVNLRTPGHAKRARMTQITQGKRRQ